MRSLLRFLALCAAVSLCVCYDSNESNESHEDVFVPPSRANTFISRPRGNTYTQNRGTGLSILRPTKSPAERRAEVCEEYYVCRSYAYRHGYQRAYQMYFGVRNQPTRPAGTRRF